VITLVHTDFDNREYEVMWEGKTTAGARAKVGMYIIRMQADQYIQTRTILYVQ